MNNSNGLIGDYIVILEDKRLIRIRILSREDDGTKSDLGNYFYLLNELKFDEINEIYSSDPTPHLADLKNSECETLKLALLRIKNIFKKDIALLIDINRKITKELDNPCLGLASS